MASESCSGMTYISSADCMGAWSKTLGITYKIRVGRMESKMDNYQDLENPRTQDNLDWKAQIRELGKLEA